MINITTSRDIVNSLISSLKDNLPSGWQVSRYVQNMDNLTFLDARGKVFIDEVAREGLSSVSDLVTVNVNFFTGNTADTDNLYDEMAFICGFLTSRAVYTCGIYHIPLDGVSGLSRVENTYITGSQWFSTIKYYASRIVLPIE